VNSLPKTVTRQRRDCDLNPGPSVPESSALTTRLPSHPTVTLATRNVGVCNCERVLQAMITTGQFSDMGRAICLMRVCSFVWPRAL